MGIALGPARLLDQWDFKFGTVEVEATSTAGTPYKRRIEVGMPQIPPEFLNSVFYLYKSREEAEAGVNKGGTGFFVSIRSSGTGGTYVYAVSNWHVAVKHGFSVIRINTTDGGVDIFDLDPADWFFKPQWHDIAVSDAPVFTERHKFRSLSTDMLATKDFAERAEFGPGEDVFMIGRFVDRDGGPTNVPSVRFGNISVMPQKIPSLTGAIDAESYILDVHSRTGYSGSPVFVYRTTGSDLRRFVNRTSPKPESKMLMLLGIHWGQFPETWEIKSDSELEEINALPATAKYVQGWSGMTLVSPASAILELLEMPELRKRRVKELKEHLEKRARAPIAEIAVSETPPNSAVPTVEASNPTHKADFTSLLNAAATKKSPNGQT